MLRAHAAIGWSAEAGAHLVRKLDSHNGSVLDGVPLGRRSRLLRDGSVQRLGSVLAVWEHIAAVDDPDRPEPAAGTVDRDAIRAWPCASRPCAPRSPSSSCRRG